jgi:hypothetical protein
MLNVTGQTVDHSKSGLRTVFILSRLSEHYRANGNQTSFTKAIELWRKFEDRLLDRQYGGYVDTAFRNWSLPSNPGKSTISERPFTFIEHSQMRHFGEISNRFWIFGSLKFALQ